MSTRCTLAIKNLDNTYTSIYCHFDGYPEFQLPMLNTHYQDETKVRALMALGNLSILQPELGTKHNFNWIVEGECTFYGRDRGESGNEAVTSDFARLSQIREEYLYIFENGLWNLNDSHHS
jgi:hypothetical protein